MPGRTVGHDACSQPSSHLMAPRVATRHWPQAAAWLWLLGTLGACSTAWRSESKWSLEAVNRDNDLDEEVLVPAGASLAPPSQVPLPPPELSPLVADMPVDSERSIADVGTYIRSHEPDRLRRVRALHDWVADRIAYDAEVLERYPWKAGDDDVLAEHVFARRRGVCAGYANLLVALGEVTGDPIEYRSSNEAYSQPHAWNTIDIDGLVIWMDATWDAGRVEDGKFHKRFSSQYFQVGGEHPWSFLDTMRPVISRGAQPP
jgi:transglutaminase-like putative cysteine protease